MDALRQSDEIELIVGVARRLPDSERQADVTSVSAGIARHDLTATMRGTGRIGELATGIGQRE